MANQSKGNINLGLATTATRGGADLVKSACCGVAAPLRRTCSCRPWLRRGVRSLRIIACSAPPLLTARAWACLCLATAPVRRPWLYGRNRSPAGRAREHEPSPSAAARRSGQGPLLQRDATRQRRARSAILVVHAGAAGRGVVQRTARASSCRAARASSYCAAHPFGPNSGFSALGLALWT